ncbi:hypothetical protein GS909_07030 [Rhodococcus hoagii]|nr:hypothetical protein [Prescottella equi]
MCVEDVAETVDLSAGFNDAAYRLDSAGAGECADAAGGESGVGAADLAGCGLDAVAVEFPCAGFVDLGVVDDARLFGRTVDGVDGLVVGVDDLGVRVSCRSVPATS